MSNVDLNLWPCRTLQELVAPRAVLFFDENYAFRGTKHSIVTQIMAITAIDNLLLVGEKLLGDFSVAQKMSWAASRHTTRKEDEAYSLLGIFGINLPLLYGEDENAFRRLQEEIIRTTVDLSIFGWKLQPPPSAFASQGFLASHPSHLGESLLCGVLAHAPKDFLDCGSLVGGVDGLREFSTSNIGIKIRTRMHLRWLEGNEGPTYILPIAVQHRDYIGIKLRQVDHEQYLREDAHMLVDYRDGACTVPPVERYLLTRLPRVPGLSQHRCNLARVILKQKRFFLLQLKPQKQPGCDMALSDPWPLHRYDHRDLAFFGPEDSKRDFGIIKLTTTIQLPLQYNKVFTTQIQCLFGAFGWYGGTPEEAQFTLIEAKPYEVSFAAIQPGISDWDQDSNYFIRKLDDVGIPRQTGVVSILDKMNACIFVTFEAEKTDGPAAVSWSVEFSCKLYPMGECPEVEQQPWAFI